MANRRRKKTPTTTIDMETGEFTMAWASRHRKIDPNPRPGSGLLHDYQKRLVDMITGNPEPVVTSGSRRPFVAADFGHGAAFTSASALGSIKALGLSYEEYVKRHLMPDNYANRLVEHAKNEFFKKQLMGVLYAESDIAEYHFEWKITAWDSIQPEPYDDILELFEREKNMATQRFRKLMQDAMTTACEALYPDANALAGLKLASDRVHEVIHNDKLALFVPRLPDYEVPHDQVVQAVNVFLVKMRIGSVASVEFAAQLKKESAALYDLTMARIPLPPEIAGQIAKHTGSTTGGLQA